MNPNEQDPNFIPEAMIAAVAVVFADLDFIEVVTLNLTLALGGSLAERNFSEKLSPLYTEGPYQMTRDVKRILAGLCQQRIQEGK